MFRAMAVGRDLAGVAYAALGPQFVVIAEGTWSVVGYHLDHQMGDREHFAPSSPFVARSEWWESIGHSSPLYQMARPEQRIRIDIDASISVSCGPSFDLSEVNARSLFEILS
jgi:hypothetical protein